MQPFLRERFGNPSSAHRAGRAAREAIDLAREEVGRFLGCDAREICFVSSGSEANALALKGLVLARKEPARARLVTSAVEHPSVLEAARQLEGLGATVTHLPVDAEGLLGQASLQAALAPGTLLASVMWVNNETGAIQPIERVAALCRDRGILLHVDAVQAAGKLPLRASDLPCDLMTVSAHKLRGPKGVAALYVRRGLQLSPLVAGHQERGRHGGTENVAAIVGFGKACALAAPAGKEQQIRELRDLLERRILEQIAGSHRNGPAALRVANTTNLRFDGCDGETLLIGLDLLGICASSGAACSSGTQTPSHVLRAMGLSAAQAQASLRFSLGSETTLGDVEQVLAALPDLVLGCRR